MNKTLLMGRLTRDAEIRRSGETTIAKFTVAVDRRFKRQNEEQTADFIGCTAFGKTAEFLERFGHKGTKFVIEGRIQTGSYTDQEGARHYTFDVIAEQVEFAESKAAGGGAPFDPKNAASADGFVDIPDNIDEEVPFN